MAGKVIGLGVELAIDILLSNHVIKLHFENKCYTHIFWATLWATLNFGRKREREKERTKNEGMKLEGVCWGGYDHCSLYTCMKF